MRKLTIFSLLVVIVLSVSFEAFGWETTECQHNSSVTPYFPNGDDVWPFYVAENIGADAGSLQAIQNAVSNWNGVEGAIDSLSIVDDDYGYCSTNDNAAVVAWDSGACMQWDSEYVMGVTAYWYNSSCVLQEINIYFNYDAPFETVDDLSSVATHEFGHYLHYAHNWYEISVMGYTYLGVPAMTFLTANDHDYLRNVFPDGSSSVGQDLQIHRFKLLDDIVPDQVSYSYAAEPSCSGSGCEKLTAGSRVIAEVSYGNAGDKKSDQTTIAMFLGEHSIGNWSVDSIDPGAWKTVELSGRVSESVPPGEYVLRFKIDPEDNLAQADQSSSSGNEIIYETKMKVLPPAGWSCDDDLYGDGENCDCMCGVVDSDCTDETLPVAGCGDNQCGEAFCDDNAECGYYSEEFEGDSCDDESACTSGDVCKDGECVGVEVDCSSYADGECIVGSCDKDTGVCFSDQSLMNNQACDTGVACVEGLCLNGVCLQQSGGCDDGVACTIDSCAELTGQCSYTVDHTSCDDGDPCTHDICDSNVGCRYSPVAGCNVDLPDNPDNPDNPENPDEDNGSGGGCRLIDSGAGSLSTGASIFALFILAFVLYRRQKRQN